MFTMDASRMIMSWATPMTARASQRRSRPAPGVAEAAGADTVAVVMCLPICLRNGGGGLTLGTEADAASGKHTGGTLRFVNGFPGELFAAAREGDRRVMARAQRADACRNRDRLLDVAGEAFANCGTEASLENIAKCAGVGIGTLY